MRGQLLKSLVELALVVKLDVESWSLVVIVKLSVVLAVMELVVWWMWMVCAWMLSVVESCIRALGQSLASS